MIFIFLSTETLKFCLLPVMASINLNLIFFNLNLFFFNLNLIFFNLNLFCFNMDLVSFGSSRGQPLSAAYTYPGNINGIAVRMVFWLISQFLFIVVILWRCLFFTFFRNEEPPDIFSCFFRIDSWRFILP